MNTELANDKLTWIPGGIAFWDEEKGRGYIQPTKIIDNSPYGNGQYYFDYTTLTDVKYKPTLGGQVLFRTRTVNGYKVAEIMEVL